MKEDATRPACVERCDIWITTKTHIQRDTHRQADLFHTLFTTCIVKAAAWADCHQGLNIMCAQKAAPAH